MHGLAAFGDFSWNAGHGGLWEFWLECGAWRPLGVFAGMRGLSAFGEFSWVATANYPGVIPVTTPLGCTFSYPTQNAGLGGLLGILAGMQGLAAFGNFSWNAGPGGLWGF